MSNKSKQIYDNIEYLLDKLNLTFEMPVEQLKAFSQQLANKIITWELMESLFTVIVCMALLIGSVAYTLKLHKREKFIKFLKDNWYESDLKKAESRKFIKYIVVLVGLSFVVVFIVPTLISNIITTIQCFVFPEKIILEFLSNYL